MEKRRERRSSALTMADQAESSRRGLPRTPPPSPTFYLYHDETGLWNSESSSSSSAPSTDLLSNTDVLSLWSSNYPVHPGPEAEEEPLADVLPDDVPTSVNFDLEHSFLDLEDWKATDTAVTEAAPDDTLPLSMQLNAEAEASYLQLALGQTQEPETFVAPLALRIHPQPDSSETATQEASPLPLAIGLQVPRARVTETESPTLPLARGMETPGPSLRIQPAPPPLSSSPPTLFPFATAPPLWNLPLIPCTIPVAPPLWTLRTIPCTVPMAPPFWNLPTIPCTSPTAQAPSENVPSVPCTSPVAPPLWNFLQRPCPQPERRKWSVILSSPPSERPNPLSQSTSESESQNASFSAHHFFPSETTGGQQQVTVAAHASVTICTPNASANFKFSTGLVPATRPRRSQAKAPRRSWTSSHQPWISPTTNQDVTTLPTPRLPRFLLPAPADAAAATMPAPSAPLLDDVGNMLSVENMQTQNARGDAPAAGDQQQLDQQRVQFVGESSKQRKKAKHPERTC